MKADVKNVFNKSKGKLELPPHPDPWWRNPSEISARAFLYGKHYQRRTVGATIGMWGRGKTTKGLFEAVDMARKGLRGWYVNGEEEQEELDRRVAAICKFHGISKENLGGRLFVQSVVNNSVRLVTMNGAGPELNEEVFAWFSGFIKENNIDAVMVDPLISFHRVREGDNGDMDFLVKEGFKLLATDHDCAIELFHHPTKPKPGAIETTVEDGRGAGAVLAAVRSARVFNFITITEATQFNIAESDRRRYIRITNGKANAGPTGNSEFFYLDVETLPSGDVIAVAKPWDPPKPFEGVSKDHMLECRRLSASGDYRKDPRSPDWFGHQVAKVLGIEDVGPKTPGRRKVTSIITIWLKTKALDVVNKPDKSGVSREFIVPGPFNDTPKDSSDEYSVH